MNLKLTTLLALFAASPLTMGGLTILAPEKFKDSAKVRGRNLSEGEIVLMSRATSDTNSSEVCADPVFWQPVTSDSHCKTKVYNGITELWFSEPTKDPPPIDVTINGNECYHCTISVKEIGKDTAWFMDWGLSSMEDGTKIVCEKSTVCSMLID